MAPNRSDETKRAELLGRRRDAARRIDAVMHGWAAQGDRAFAEEIERRRERGNDETRAVGTRDERAATEPVPSMDGVFWAAAGGEPEPPPGL